eukprot:1158455-Pelagomonas_calceolata.AAC.2
MNWEKNRAQGLTSKPSHGQGLKSVKHTSRVLQKALLCPMASSQITKKGVWVQWVSYKDPGASVGMLLPSDVNARSHTKRLKVQTRIYKDQWVSLTDLGAPEGMLLPSDVNARSHSGLTHRDKDTKSHTQIKESRSGASEVLQLQQALRHPGLWCRPGCVKACCSCRTPAARSHAKKKKEGGVA